jgi:hypothetical protein
MTFLSSIALQQKVRACISPLSRTRGPRCSLVYTSTMTRHTIAEVLNCVYRGPRRYKGIRPRMAGDFLS